MRGRFVLAVGAMLLGASALGAQTSGTVETNIGVHFQVEDNQALGPTVSLGIFPARHVLLEGSFTYFPSIVAEADPKVNGAITALRGIFVLPAGASPVDFLFGAGFARYHLFEDGYDGISAFQLMPGIRLGSDRGFGVRFNGTFDYAANEWAKGIQAGASFRFGGRRPVLRPAVVVTPVVVEPIITYVEQSPIPLPDPTVTPPMVVRLTTVHFAFDRADLTPIARDKLRMAAGELRSNQNMIVELIGHTDSRGSMSYNQRLSERRAASVRGYLVTLGILNERISTRGMGETAPIADNATAEGRARNRRVEVQGHPVKP